MLKKGDLVVIIARNSPFKGQTGQVLATDAGHGYPIRVLIPEEVNDRGQVLRGAIYQYRMDEVALQEKQAGA